MCPPVSLQGWGWAVGPFEYGAAMQGGLENPMLEFTMFAMFAMLDIFAMQPC